MQPLYRKPVIICLFIIIVTFISILPAKQASLEASSVPCPVPQGRSAVLMDFDSGRILYDKNSHERIPPASVTKIMTALLVIENGNLDQLVEVSETAADTRECTIYLQAGEQRTRQELLYACMLPSANDAAVALAESVASNLEDFVQLMNQRAAELGMNDTHFCNPHGLHEDGHYTSAHDLALLSREAMKYTVFRDLVGTHNIIIPGSPGGEERSLWNQNRLLYRYDGTLGVKTGYTKQAGNCLVGAAQRNDMLLIAVTLNSPAVYDDVIGMMDHGFSTYQLQELEGQAEPILVKVNGGEEKSVLALPDTDLLVAASGEEIALISCRFMPYTEVPAPVKKGDLLGVCKLYKQSEEIASIDLVAADSVALKQPWTYSLKPWALILFKCCIFIFLIIIISKNKKAQEIFKSGLRYIVLKFIRKRSSRNRSVRDWR